MSRYLPQPDENVGRFGSRRKVELVKTFSEMDVATLDTSVNAFLLGLETIDALPIIKDIKFQTVGTAGNTRYASQVWYVLVEQ